MKFEDSESPKESRPHPDYQANYLHYNRLTEKWKFDESVRIKTHKWDGNITHTEIAIGPFGPSATVFIISFHQDLRKFREEFDTLLNNFRNRNLIKQ